MHHEVRIAQAAQIVDSLKPRNNTTLWIDITRRPSFGEGAVLPIMRNTRRFIRVAYGARLDWEIEFLGWWFAVIARRGIWASEELLLDDPAVTGALRCRGER